MMGAPGDNSQLKTCLLAVAGGLAHLPPGTDSFTDRVKRGRRMCLSSSTPEPPCRGWIIALIWSPEWFMMVEVSDCPKDFGKNKERIMISRRFTGRLDDSRGFTLLEILAAVAIFLILLAAIAAIFREELYNAFWGAATPKSTISYASVRLTWIVPADPSEVVDFKTNEIGTFKIKVEGFNNSADAQKWEDYEGADALVCEVIPGYVSVVKINNEKQDKADYEIPASAVAAVDELKQGMKAYKAASGSGGIIEIQLKSPKPADGTLVVVFVESATETIQAEAHFSVSEP